MILSAPCCGALLDIRPDPNEPESVPKPGDFTVCESCGRFLRFDEAVETGDHLRVATDDDIRLCPSEALAQLTRFARLVRVRLRERNGR
jgi:hypothetical protein